MRVPLSILLLSASAVCLPAPASAAPKKKAPEAWAVILGGGKEAKDGEQALQSFHQKSPDTLKWAEGYPKVLVSNTLPGLNPGFHIAVLGFCADKAQAAEATRALNDALGGGVYFKKTAGPSDGLCPEVKDPAPEGYSLEQEAPLATSGPDARRSWFIYKADPTPDLPEDECETPAYVVQVRQGAQVLAEQRFDTSCRKGDGTPEDPGESTEWNLTLLEVDGVQLLWARQSRYCCDDGSHTHTLHAFGCGKLTQKHLGSHGQYADPSSMDVEVTRSEDGERQVVRTTYMENHGDPEPDLMEHAWSPKACRFEQNTLVPE